MKRKLNALWIISMVLVAAIAGIFLWTVVIFWEQVVYRGVILVKALVYGFLWLPFLIWNVFREQPSIEYSREVTYIISFGLVTPVFFACLCSMFKVPGIDNVLITVLVYLSIGIMAIAYIRTEWAGWFFPKIKME